jgi:signal peptidase I
MFGENRQNFEDKGSYYGVGSFIVEIIKVFFWALVIIVPIRLFLFQPFFVQGASMEPNFEDGEYLIVNELGYKRTELSLAGNQIFTVQPFKELKRGDVVVFRYPLNPSQYFIKRIIGLPGETITIKDGKVEILNNDSPVGFMLDENAYLPPHLETSGDLTVNLGSDEYFVLGDNRAASHDSRSWGTLNKDKVIGKVLLRAWPIPRAALY